jgi:hypothetical protein
VSLPLPPSLRGERSALSPIAGKTLVAAEAFGMQALAAASEGLERRSAILPTVPRSRPLARQWAAKMHSKAKVFGTEIVRRPTGEFSPNGAQ